MYAPFLSAWSGYVYLSLSCITSSTNMSSYRCCCCCCNLTCSACAFAGLERKMVVRIHTTVIGSAAPLLLPGVAPCSMACCQTASPVGREDGRRFAGLSLLHGGICLTWLLKVNHLEVNRLFLRCCGRRHILPQLLLYRYVYPPSSYTACCARAQDPAFRAGA